MKNINSYDNCSIVHFIISHEVYNLDQFNNHM